MRRWRREGQYKLINGCELTCMSSSALINSCIELSCITLRVFVSQPPRCNSSVQPDDSFLKPTQAPANSLNSIQSPSSSLKLLQAPARIGGAWEVDRRWMGGECDECVWLPYEQAVTAPLYKGAPRKSKNLASRGIPGRFLSLVLISPNLA